MTTTPESLALLAGAAELRAAGAHWPDAAAQLAVDPKELRRLAAEHAGEYAKLARRARAEVEREALAVTIATLRELMRSPEPGVRLLAATTYVRYHLSTLRHDTAKARARLQSDAKRIEEFDAKPLPPLPPLPRLPQGTKTARAANASDSAEVAKQQAIAAAKTVTPAAGEAPDPARRRGPAPAAAHRRVRAAPRDRPAAREPGPRGEAEGGEARGATADRLARGGLEDQGLKPLAGYCR